jgi:hypothetical protein
LIRMPDFARRQLAVGQERQASNSVYRTPNRLLKYWPAIRPVLPASCDYL